MIRQESSDQTLYSIRLNSQSTYEILLNFECRANEIVYDSSGKPRPDTGGGASRKLFMQLPGVGAKTAKIWYDLGYRYLPLQYQP